MKKVISILSICSIMLLSGCTETSEVTADGNSISLPNAGITLNFPDEYSVLTGNEIYETFSGAMSFDISAEELKKSSEENGLRYLAHATNGIDIIVISAQDMIPDEDTERPTLADYARQVHDTTIFEYYASGYRTTSNTSLTEASYGGKDGWVSFFEVILPLEDADPEFVIGYIEFMFEEGADIYSIQIGMQQQTDHDTAAKAFEWIKAE